METITCKVNRKTYELVKQTDNDLHIVGINVGCKGCAAYVGKEYNYIDITLCVKLGSECFHCSKPVMIWKLKK